MSDVCMAVCSELEGNLMDRSCLQHPWSSHLSYRRVFGADLLFYVRVFMHTYHSNDIARSSASAADI
jgi:hypothetical protein